MSNHELPQTVSALARELGMTRQTLYNHIARGNLRAKKAGPFMAIEPKDAAAFRNRLKIVRYGRGGKPVKVFS